MTRQHLLERITNLAKPLAHSLGLSLWGLELSSGPRLILRVYLEKAADEGVGIDDCASFSRLFGISLDVEDIMPGAYVLEVSSPGFERLFFTAAQLAGAVGRLLDISLHEAPADRGGRKKFRGQLLAGPEPENDLPDDALFVLRLENEEEQPEDDLVFSFANVKKARQVWIAPEKVRPGKSGRQQQKDARKR
ncbi:ribosome maturation factor RimP [Desulfovibrio sp. OttesenSCG-928-F20]|nr:ribosome maturation factor RimP [Desulfovibrio sp. OttesenSCG-928-F20]